MPIICSLTGSESLVCFKILIPQNSKCPEGTKPMLIFAGDMFDVNEEYRRLKSLLIGQYFDYVSSKIA